MKSKYQAIGFVVTPENAARQLAVEVEIIYTMVEEKKLETVKFLPEYPNLITQRSIDNNLPKESLPEYQESEKLRGIPININKAGEKYIINKATIGRWARKGLIRQLGRDGNKILLDEADVAYCALVHHATGGQGIWVFDKSGKPYHPDNKRKQ